MSHRCQVSRSTLIREIWIYRKLIRMFREMKL
jgi:hypothetical protein